jgi:phosphoribosylamine---glycine ligase
MKFLLYSQSGEGCGLLSRIAQDGNEVCAFIKDGIYKTVYDGIIAKTDTPDSFIDADTIIVFDMSGNGKIADRYRRNGHLVYGASKFADELEHDRTYGFEVMKKCGIQTPETKTFTDFKKGVEFVKNSKKRLVFKPSGSMPCKLTYVSEDGPELINYMNFVEKHFGSKIDEFVLQEFIEGALISSEYFCGPNGFVEPGNHTVEIKKFMNDDLGPSTGCSGNITWPVDTWVLDEGVGKAESICKSEGYIGQIDLNAVVNDGGIWGLEWTPRFGYDATPTLFCLVDNPGKLISDIVRGETKSIKFNGEYAGSLRVTIPPYPVEPQKGNSEELSPNIGVPIQNYEEHQDCLYFYEVMYDDQLVHSGGTGVICSICNVSDDCMSILDEPYEIAECLQIPDKQYRTDLQEPLNKMVKDFEKYVD